MKATDKPQINVRLEPETWEGLREAAHQTKLSKTAIVEMALKDFLKVVKN